MNNRLTRHASQDRRDANSNHSGLAMVSRPMAIRYGPASNGGCIVSRGMAATRQSVPARRPILEYRQQCRDRAPSSARRHRDHMATVHTMILTCRRTRRRAGRGLRSPVAIRDLARGSAVRRWATPSEWASCVSTVIGENRGFPSRLARPEQNGALGKPHSVLCRFPAESSFSLAQL
jgi:hypothetical protein